LADNDNEIDRIWNAQITAKAQRGYRVSISKFILWLFQNHIGLLNFAYICTSGLAEKPTTATILQSFHPVPNPGVPPVIFAALTADIFIKWLQTLTQKNGLPLRISSCYTYRSALFNLFRDYDMEYSSDFRAKLKGLFKGLKREKASLLQDGVGRIQSGKHPISVSTLEFLARTILSLAGTEGVFAHTMLTLCWNLMCRVGNAASVKISHMEWIEDALGYYFSVMKNDQVGDRPKDPKHVYANPLKPLLCHITALGLYLLSFPMVAGQVELFPGSKQEQRFSRFMRFFLQMPAVVEHPRTQGLKPEDVGTHSLRKGSATYVCGGSTACPSLVAVQLRVGWALPGVTGTYLRYEAAGDQFVGRTVAMLPVGSPDFALLPPHFPVGDPVVVTTVASCFPNLAPSMVKAAEMGLASVIFHWPALDAVLCANHVARSSPIFKIPGLLQELSGKIISG
jgi:hypothetical protein